MMRLSIQPKNTSEVMRMNRKYQIELEQETDGRWIAEIEALSGAMVYGNTREQAIINIEALALRILADRLEHGDASEELNLLFAA
ncbi:MAG: type II toxin-antitoxin system HicB family antitoxin [Methylococcaceae bacterium]